MINGKTYFSNISNNLLTIFNGKGKALKKFPKNLEDIVAIPPFVFQDRIYVVFENGRLEFFSVEGNTRKEKIQLAGFPEVVSFRNKEKYLVESSISQIKIYHSQLNLLFKISQEFSEDVILSAVTIDFLLIHHRIQNKAIICDKDGRTLTRKFGLYVGGE